MNWAVTGTGVSPANAADFANGVLPTGTINFATGDATPQVITVNVAGDTTVESDEGFTVTLSGASGATVTTPSASGTILNDDPAGPVVLQPGPSDSHDIWTTSTYSYAPSGGGPGGGLADGVLKVGGWGDLYYSLLQFNLTGLPTAASSAQLVLYDINANDASTTGLYLERVTSAWDWTTSGTGSDHNRLWWADRPATVQVGTSPLPAPAIGSFYTIDITSLYNAWQSGAVANYGVELQPVGNNNNFDIFASSRADIVSQRPSLIIQAATTAPAAPSTPDLTAATDSGASNADNVTNVTTPVFVGTAEANAVVTLFDGGASIGSGTADGSGNWSITAGTLGQGTHSVTAKATNLAGNVSVASAALSVTIDTAAPAAPSTPDLTAASDSGASNTDNVTSVTTPVFVGTAEANAAVTLLDGATVIGSGTANGSGNWSITSSTLGLGVHSITAKSTDLAGNVSMASAALPVTIQNDVTVIEAAGATRLVQVGNQFQMNPSAGGTGPSLRFQGNAVTAGQFGTWTPIGAEATAGGYEVAWKQPGFDQYIVWNTDTAGNYTGVATGVVSGSDAALETLEPSFNQDLNGDGTTGPLVVTIEAAGSTRLVQVGTSSR